MQRQYAASDIVMKSCCFRDFDSPTIIFVAAAQNLRCKRRAAARQLHSPEPTATKTKCKPLLAKAHKSLVYTTLNNKKPMACPSPERPARQTFAMMVIVFLPLLLSQLPVASGSHFRYSSSLWRPLHPTNYQSASNIETRLGTLKAPDRRRFPLVRAGLPPGQAYAPLVESPGQDGSTVACCVRPGMLALSSFLRRCPGAPNFACLQRTSSYTGVAEGSLVTISGMFTYSPAGPSVGLSNMVVTQVDIATDSFSAVKTAVVSFASRSLFTGSWTVCCRLSSFQNNADDSVKMWHTVDLRVASGQFWTNTAPVVSQIPIQRIVAGALVTWQIAASDADGDPLQYRLATPTEQGDSGSSQPTSLSINSSNGIVSFTPSPGIHSFMFVVSDGKADIAVDMLLQAESAVKYCSNTCSTCTQSSDCGGQPCGRNDAPSFVQPTSWLGNDTDMNYCFFAGTNSVLHATVQDTGNECTSVQMQPAQLPTGATITLTATTAAPAASATYEISWTPTVQQEGTHILTFFPSNGAGFIGPQESVQIVVPQVSLSEASPPTTTMFPAFLLSTAQTAVTILGSNFTASPAFRVQMRKAGDPWSKAISLRPKFVSSAEISVQVPAESTFGINPSKTLNVRLSNAPFCNYWTEMPQNLTYYPACPAGLHNVENLAFQCVPCGNASVYCPSGTILPLLVQHGHYSTGGNATTRTGQSLCEKGFFCVDGLRYSCPQGLFSLQGSSTNNSCIVPSNSPTPTLSPTPSITPTWSATSTATATTSSSPSGSASATVSAFPTTTPSTTLVWSPSPTLSATSMSSPTGSATSTATATTSSSPSGSASVTVSAFPTPTPSTTLVWSPSPTLSATSMSSPTGSATSTATATTSSSPGTFVSPQASFTASVTASASLSFVMASTIPSAESATPFPSSSNDRTRLALRVARSGLALDADRRCQSAWWGVCVTVQAEGAYRSAIQPILGMWCPACRNLTQLLKADLARDLRSFVASSATSRNQAPAAVRCIRERACQVSTAHGTAGQLQCSPGHTGPLCASCELGWRPRNDHACTQCEQCSQRSDADLIYVACLLAFALVWTAAVSALGVRKRGTVGQDLMVGSLRVAFVYFSLVLYTTNMFFDDELSAPQLRSSATDPHVWHAHCTAKFENAADSYRNNRKQSTHINLTEEVHEASAIIPETILALGRYPADPTANSVQKLLSWLGLATGSLGISSTSTLSCTAAAIPFRTQMEIISLCAMSFLAAATVGLLCLGVYRQRHFDSISSKLATQSSSSGHLVDLKRARSLSQAAARPSSSSMVLTQANPLSIVDHSRSAKTAAGYAGQGKNPVVGKVPEHDKQKLQNKKGGLALPKVIAITWMMARALCSLYLFSWSMATTIALQALSPGWEWQGKTYLPAMSFGAKSDEVQALAIGMLVINLFIYPSCAMYLVQYRAERQLDPLQHESATVAVLTAGYRLQLTPSQAMRAILKSHSTEQRLLDQQSKQSRLMGELAMAAAEQASKAMSSRLGALSRYLPSHCFAVVKHLQLGVVLCAMWLTHDKHIRAIVSILALIVVACLTALLRPYNVSQLNRLDVACNIVVAVHIVVLLVVPVGAPGLLWGLTGLHASVSLQLLWYTAIGVFRWVRFCSIRISRAIRSCLPALKRKAIATQDRFASEFAEAQLPSARDLAEGILARCGCISDENVKARLLKQDVETTKALQGPSQRWTALRKAVHDLAFTALETDNKEPGTTAVGVDKIISAVSDLNISQKLSATDKFLKEFCVRCEATCSPSQSNPVPLQNLAAQLASATKTAREEALNESSQKRRRLSGLMSLSPPTPNNPQPTVQVKLRSTRASFVSPVQQGFRVRSRSAAMKRANVPSSSLHNNPAHTRSSDKPLERPLTPERCNSRGEV